MEIKQIICTPRFLRFEAEQKYYVIKDDGTVIASPTFEYATTLGDGLAELLAKSEVDMYFKWESRRTGVMMHVWTKHLPYHTAIVRDKSAQNLKNDLDDKIRKQNFAPFEGMTSRQFFAATSPNPVVMDQG